MKFRLIALAALAAAAGSSHATSLANIDAARNAGTLKEVVIFGASAQTPMVAAYMKNTVCAGAADYNEFWNDASGKSFRAYSCTTANALNGFATGTPVLVVKRDKDGSIYGVNQVAAGTPGLSMVVTAADCSAFTNGATPAATCGTAVATVPHAGLSDVEPAQFAVKPKINGVATTINQPVGADDVGTAWAVPTNAQLSSLNIASMGQTIFGVAVSPALRNALQAAQGLTVGDNSDAQMPSLPRGFIAGALSGFVRGNVAGFPNWKSVTGVAGDDIKSVKICRRTNGSGTQAASNLFFLEAGTLLDTSKGMLGPITAANAPVGTTVVENAGTGDVETCLTNNLVSDYALGVISREKDPLVNGKTYRYVKIDGAAPSQALARVGSYGMVYTSSMQWPKTVNAGFVSFLTKMRDNAVTSNKIGTYVSAEAKGGLLASPHKWEVAADTCASATDPQDAIYGSCVERIDVGDATYNPAVRLYGKAAYKTTSTAPLHTVK